MWKIEHAKFFYSNTLYNSVISGKIRHDILNFFFLYNIIVALLLKYIKAILKIAIKKKNIYVGKDERKF